MDFRFGVKTCAIFYRSNAGASEREGGFVMCWLRNGVDRMLVVHRCVLASTFDECWVVAQVLSTFLERAHSENQ